MRVLIAEDDRISRRMLARRLEQWGHDVVAAANGREAWEAFQNDEFSIVVSDWMMPEMDGLELVRRIRNARADGYVFVILLTAKSQKEDIVVGMEAGADDFLSKPFDQAELRVRLRAGERILELEHDLARQNRRLQAANQRMERDLDAAAKVQQSLLPTSLPQVDRAEFAWSFRPCDQLAGDILNVFSLDDRHVGMYVADVSGHGVAAALLAVAVSRVLTPQPSMSSLLVKPGEDGTGEDGTGKHVVPPATVARELNRRFQMAESGDRYFTIVYGVLDTQTREFRYVSAGHPPLVLHRGERPPELLPVEAFAVGWLDDVEYDEHLVQLAPGDRLLIYSDGVPEAMNGRLDQFGNERLTRSLTATRADCLADSVKSLRQDVERWCGDEGPKDDVSLLGLEIL